MIRSEHEYREMLERLERDRDFLRAQRERLESMGLSAEEVARAMEPALSFHEQLKEEVDYYERIRRGDFQALVNLNGLGRMLIGMRIAQGLSQRELAARLGVSEAQISRDERNEYHGITLERAQRILDALGVTVVTHVQDPNLPSKEPVLT